MLVLISNQKEPTTCSVTQIKLEILRTYDIMQCQLCEPFHVVLQQFFVLELLTRPEDQHTLR